jgi:hypothetical protein
MSKNFYDQYKDPKWQMRRVEYINNQMADLYDCGYTSPMCEWCQSDDKQLHLHHIIYHKDRKVWEYDNSELILLCERCHKEFHYYQDNIKKNISEASNIADNLYDLDRIAAILSMLNPPEMALAYSKLKQVFPEYSEMAVKKTIR